MSDEIRPFSGKGLWLIVELVILAGIITGFFLVRFGSGSFMVPQSWGYIFLAIGIFCLVGIEVYLAVRSPQP